MSSQRSDGWCGWCGQIFLDQPETVSDCQKCGKPLNTNPPAGPVDPDCKSLGGCPLCGGESGDGQDGVHACGITASDSPDT